MAQLPNSIDCTQEVEKITRELLPVGDYLAHVIDDEMKPTKKGDGKYVELTIECLEQPHKGRWLFDRLNVVNPNKTAVEISERTLASIGKACGLATLSDTSQLKGIPMIVSVKIEKSEQYGDRNVVSGYKVAKGNQVATSEDVSPPWQKKEGEVKTPF